MGASAPTPPGKSAPVPSYRHKLLHGDSKWQFSFLVLKSTRIVITQEKDFFSTKVVVHSALLQHIQLRIIRKRKERSAGILRAIQKLIKADHTNQTKKDEKSETKEKRGAIKSGNGHKNP